MAIGLHGPRGLHSLGSRWEDGTWDRKLMRVNSVYRLLRQGRIGFARALELLAQRHTPKEMKTLRGTVEGWREFPLRGRMLP